MDRCLRVMPPMARRASEEGIVRAEGCYLYTEEGRRLIDFASGVAVCNLGHNHPEVVAAAKAQMDKMVHVCHNLLYYEPYVTLAEKLVALTGGDTKVYFSNSGAEAVEGAVKLAKYATGRPAVVAFQDAFHGRTMLCASLTASHASYRRHYEPLVPGVYFLEYPNLFRSPYPVEGGACPEAYFTQFDRLFARLIDPADVAAIVMEPVQGEGGYVPAPPEFVRHVRALCDKHGILLVFDEVQTGFGRTGRMFAYEHFGVRPDIMACAKGIANGFPLSAVVGRRAVMDRWAPGAHGGTFGGNPVSCAAALATIRVLEGGAVANGAAMGAHLMARLRTLARRCPAVGDLRGLGMMIGMELVRPDGAPDPDLTRRVLAGAAARGLFLLSCGCWKNVVRFIAPLTVTRAVVDEAADILEAVFAEEAGG
jgi:4-aminobutyrate aminotransferase